MGIAIFIGVALLFDIYYTVVYRLFPIDNSMLYEAQQASENLSTFQNIDLSLILYSMLNGFYEEIFFLGVCLSVKPEKRKYYFIYSLVIRYSFHTYQGNVSALAIGFLVGGIYYLLYTRKNEKKLIPILFSPCNN